MRNRRRLTHFFVEGSVVSAPNATAAGLAGRGAGPPGPPARGWGVIVRLTVAGAEVPAALAPVNVNASVPPGPGRP